jgi:2-dehydro-3-deoxyphosphogluconate aldolase/(4S)-4-hydroxy-2-oxoglutarate aldolase
MPDPALLARLRAARVVPVVRTSTAAHAATVIGWLREAGISIFEITMTIPDAPALIRDLASDKALLVGAGTVPDAAAARACLAAGARFLVAPWVDPALAGGADVVKLFPASSAGGPGHVKALASVFPGVAFCPTGGVSPGNFTDYLAAGAAFVGMGGALVDERRIAAGDRAAIQAAARQLL